MGDSQHTRNIQIQHGKSFTQLGYVKHFPVWVPRKLLEENLLDCISASNFLIKYDKCFIFKANCVQDEKWILYNNVEQKGSWDKWNEPPPTT